MSILLVYPIVLLAIGAVVFVAARRKRAQRLAIPPWAGAWSRGERYDDTERRRRRTLTVLGSALGILVAVPVMILVGFSGVAKGTVRRR